MDENGKQLTAIKHLVRNSDGSLKEESDCYFSGSSYTPEEGTPVPESLEIWFDYTTKKFVFTYQGNDPAIKLLVAKAQKQYSEQGKLDIVKFVTQVKSSWNHRVSAPAKQ